MREKQVALQALNKIFLIKNNAWLLFEKDYLTLWDENVIKP